MEPRAALALFSNPNPSLNLVDHHRYLDQVLYTTCRRSIPTSITTSNSEYKGHLLLLFQGTRSKRPRNYHLIATFIPPFIHPPLPQRVQSTPSHNKNSMMNFQPLLPFLTTFSSLSGGMNRSRIVLSFQ